MGWTHLEYGSSPVDWCEGNYLISPNIAEFINTVSNILFLLGPPVLIFLFKDYAKFITPTVSTTSVLYHSVFYYLPRQPRLFSRQGVSLICKLIVWILMRLDVCLSWRALWCYYHCTDHFWPSFIKLFKVLQPPQSSVSFDKFVICFALYNNRLRRKGWPRSDW